MTTALGLASGSMLVGGAVADAEEATPSITGASNGGVATGSTGGNISIGTIVTGENTGNSISTGNIAGSAELNGGEIDYPTDVNVTQNIAPPIVTADGGDGGVATGPGLKPPQYIVKINNKDRNNNRSKAIGTGEGGEGGEGGDGGDVIIVTPTPTP